MRIMFLELILLYLPSIRDTFFAAVLRYTNREAVSRLYHNYILNYQFLQFCFFGKYLPVFYIVQFHGSCTPLWPLALLPIFSFQLKKIRICYLENKCWHDSVVGVQCKSILYLTDLKKNLWQLIDFRVFSQKMLRVFWCSE